MNLKSLKLVSLIILKHLDRNRWFIVTFAAAVALLISLQMKFSVIYTGSSVRLGLIGTFQEHDLPQEMTKMISEGLVKEDADGHIRPNMVSGWEVNNDATLFKFKLKDNLTWSDGTTIKSQDLLFNIPNTEVTYPDDKTIQFKLKDPYSPLPSLLIQPILKKGTLLGTGPYKVTKVEKSRVFITKIILEPLISNLPKVYLRFYPSEKVAVTGFNLGEVQAILGVSNIKLFSNNTLVSLKQQTDYTKIVTILFQTQDPLLKNRSLRQSLSYQLPSIQGEEIADNPYPSSLWAYDNSAKKYLDNPDQAQAALERAKGSLPEDKFHAEIVLTATPNLEEVGKIVVETWKKLGFDSKLRIESGIPQNFQALLITQSIPVDPDQYFLWHATQTKTNLTKYDSKRADKDLEDGRKAITEDERKEKYFDFQRTLLEDAPAAFLYFPKYNTVYLKKVEASLEKVLNLSQR